MDQDFSNMKYLRWRRLLCYNGIHWSNIYFFRQNEKSPRLFSGLNSTSIDWGVFYACSIFLLFSINRDGKTNGHIESRRVTFVVLSFKYIAYHTMNSFIPCERTKEIVSRVTKSD